MKTQAKPSKGLFLLITSALLLLSLHWMSWLWVNDWENSREISNLSFEQLANFFQTMTTVEFFWFLLGTIVFQEATMLLFRYVFGKQGKNERLYIVHKGRRMGIHHAHWGVLMVIVGFFAEVTNWQLDRLLIAVGLSCILGDLLHHHYLKLFHGDMEGDGPFRNPFRKQ